jgi:hypothetical protein
MATGAVALQRALAEIPNPKSQVPNPKEFPINLDKTTAHRRLSTQIRRSQLAFIRVHSRFTLSVFQVLVLGASLELGAWDLELNALGPAADIGLWHCPSRTSPLIIPP